jgi:hypothetical protein
LSRCRDEKISRELRGLLEWGAIKNFLCAPFA